jgi:4-hydroxy-3-polyprenylbenzoate decarboxylase
MSGQNPEKGSIWRSNLGMYRIQLSGNDYRPDREIGLHYQIRRDIGIHHSDHIAHRKPLRVTVFVGGPPAHTLAAVMPLPEGMSELMFAGALAGRPFRYGRRNGFVVSMDADFCITGTVDTKALKPEGPFGDHLGYYSLTHPFPFIRVENVYHRRDAVWPFTVVGRPPQEDTAFGHLIHEITGPLVPKSIPGVKAIHAVDAAGVHPLLLAVGQERYVPYGERRPMELLTQANAILGFGHCALAKYLLMVAAEDRPDLNIHDVAAFIEHLLERVDWRRDLHFQTQTTIDTLDYTGSGLNSGSKVVMAAAGPPRRQLAAALPGTLIPPTDWLDIQIARPGIAVIQTPRFSDYPSESIKLKVWLRHLKAQPLESLAGLPLMVLSDDAGFTARNLSNFLWVTFTRSDPARDIHGVGAETIFKHWGCSGPLIIDARIKPHHAPGLEEDPEIEGRVNHLGRRGGSLHGII